jgi:hypothetical protein
MINLASTSDILRVVTASAVSTIGVQASWIDDASGTITPGRTNTNITTATTTTIVGSPGASTQRIIKDLTIENNHATSSDVITIQHYDGTTSCDLVTMTLAAGESVMGTDLEGFVHRGSNGQRISGLQWDAYTKAMGITGTIAETIPRALLIESSSATTSGTLYGTPVFLTKGQVITNVSFCSSSTAAGTPTHWGFAIYDLFRQLQAATTDFTSEAWAANTIKTKALTAPWTVPYTGFYYLAFLMTATTNVSLINGMTGAASTSNIRGNGWFAGITANTGLTTVLPWPAPCAAYVASTISIWAAVS